MAIWWALIVRRARQGTACFPPPRGIKRNRFISLRVAALSTGHRKWEADRASVFERSRWSMVFASSLSIGIQGGGDVYTEQRAGASAHINNHDDRWGGIPLMHASEIKAIRSSNMHVYNRERRYKIYASCPQSGNVVMVVNHHLISYIISNTAESNQALIEMSLHY